MLPLISRIMIRSAFIYLLLGVTLGAMMMIQKAYPFWSGIWMFREVHIEMLLFGWIIQFTLGTAYWMLPKLLEAPIRGNELLAWLMAISLNFGILVMIVSPFVSVIPFFSATGRVLQLIAILLFVTLHWRRVVSYRALEEKG